MTETGPEGQMVATLSRPPALIPDTVGGLSFPHRLLVFGGASVSGTSTYGSPSCSARIHRCVAVLVTTRCTSERHCRTWRTIRRYVTARPPAGTTRHQPQPVGPILAHIDRYLARPTRSALELTGAPERRVFVVLSVSCFSRHVGEAEAVPPLTISVPSRTPIPLPGRAPAFRGCDVSGLVIAPAHAHPAGKVHARVVRIGTPDRRG